METTSFRTTNKTNNIMKSILKIVAVAALFISGLGFEAQAQLPSVQLKDINGNTVDTSTLSNDGKPFVMRYCGGGRFLAVKEDDGALICRLEFLIRDGRAWGVRCGTRVFERD